MLKQDGCLRSRDERHTQDAECLDHPTSRTTIVCETPDRVTFMSEAPYDEAGRRLGALHWRSSMLLRHEGFRRLCQARDLLQEVPDTPLTVESLARELQISPFHFIRQFEAVFGVTPHQFRIQSRLDTAKQLLAMGHYSVTEVCMEVGFSSLGSFSALFTRRVGEAPSAYRRRVRRLVQVPGTLPTTLIPGCLSLMGRLSPSAFAASIRSFREA